MKIEFSKYFLLFFKNEIARLCKNGYNLMEFYNKFPCRGMGMAIKCLFL